MREREREIPGSVVRWREREKSSGQCATRDGERETRAPATIRHGAAEARAGTRFFFFEDSKHIRVGNFFQCWRSIDFKQYCVENFF